jgi:hypothetical protein
MPIPPNIGVVCSCHRSSRGAAAKRRLRGVRRSTAITAAAVEKAAIAAIPFTGLKGNEAV